ncbi:MAG TPA: hypothetical protein VMF86_10570 [Stellaceae bacterium]|nr:hypothetical protein [Stellaceae bacterium]
MPAAIDGFYAAYLTGAVGRGFALLECKKGHIVGADALGVLFDGEYTPGQDDTYQVTLKVKTPPNMPLIRGGSSSPQEEIREQRFTLPADFYRREFIALDLGQGPINAKLVRIRETVD